MRETILAAIRQNQPATTPLPDLTDLARIGSAGFADDPVRHFGAVLGSIGGRAVSVNDWADIEQFIHENFALRTARLITTVPQLAHIADPDWQQQPVHELADVELAVIKAAFGVAENGAVWLTEPMLAHRATPFIPQHLAVVLSGRDVLPTMHDAYARISDGDYDFGVFVAGPSKTADIEQSLVLGAHGPKTMTVFLLP